ncbi:hypothetical protein J437_LFUL006529 [Ladona fulva]|uniref:DDE Tnp4 domain-containing protein n=1 Tax=Ladona fulva TaxID=123851 RepID=A0A8K0KIP2_LADFU|nr:hypothetical protein J437_LFUL006529 [Ladona fulva]
MPMANKKARLRIPGRADVVNTAQGQRLWFGSVPFLGAVGGRTQAKEGLKKHRGFVVCRRKIVMDENLDVDASRKCLSAHTTYDLAAASQKCGSNIYVTIRTSVSKPTDLAAILAVLLSASQDPEAFLNLVNLVTDSDISKQLFRVQPFWRANDVRDTLPIVANLSHIKEERTLLKKSKSGSLVSVFDDFLDSKYSNADLFASAIDIDCESVGTFCEQLKLAAELSGWDGKETLRTAKLSLGGEAAEFARTKIECRKASTFGELNLLKRYQSKKSSRFFRELLSTLRIGAAEDVETFEDGEKSKRENHDKSNAEKVYSTLQYKINLDTFSLFPFVSQVMHIHDGIYNILLPYTQYFATGKHTTFRTIVTERAIENLKDEYMPTPTTTLWSKAANRYWELWNLPNCVGSSDGKHIRIKASAISGSTDQLQLPEPAPLPGEESVFLFYFVADEAFPLSYNLMKPYPRRQLTNERRIFN